MSLFYFLLQLAQLEIVGGKICFPRKHFLSMNRRWIGRISYRSGSAGSNILQYIIYRIHSADLQHFIQTPLRLVRLFVRPWQNFSRIVYSQCVYDATGRMFQCFLSLPLMPWHHYSPVELHTSDQVLWLCLWLLQSMLVNEIWNPFVNLVIWSTWSDKDMRQRLQT